MLGEQRRPLCQMLRARPEGQQRNYQNDYYRKDYQNSIQFIGELIRGVGHFRLRPAQPARRIDVIRPITGASACGNIRGQRNGFINEVAAHQKDAAAKNEIGVIQNPPPPPPPYPCPSAPLKLPLSLRTCRKNTTAPEAPRRCR